MTDLLPCPFCGGTADPEGWLSAEEDPVTGNALRRGPECNDCGATARSVEMWNKRPFASFVHIHDLHGVPTTTATMVSRTYVTDPKHLIIKETK